MIVRKIAKSLLNFLKSLIYNKNGTKTCVEKYAEVYRTRKTEFVLRTIRLKDKKLLKKFN